MSDTIRGVTSLADIEDDLRGTEMRAARLTRTATTRSVAAPAELAFPPISVRHALAQGGSRLVKRRPPELQRRYRTVVRMESEFRPEDEYSYLISAVSQIVEVELDELFMRPARAIANPLIAVLAVTGGPVSVLESWIQKDIATIGTASVILLAMRRGLAKADEAIRAFLDSYFTPRWIDRLRQNHIAPNVDRFREQFRNPACHGFGSFDSVAYERFSLLVVANRHLGGWYEEGPLSDHQPKDSGLLHYHLQESRHLLEMEGDALPTSDAVDRLLALAAPHASDLTIDVEPQFANQPRLRDLSPTASRLPRPFRIGDRLRFACRTNASCHVAVIDAGTSGTIAVVLPNFSLPNANALPGQTLFIPDGSFPGFEGLEITGQPGRERLLGLAFRTEIPAVLRPPLGNHLRVLNAAEVTELTEALERLVPSDWAACSCEFEIRP